MVFKPTKQLQRFADAWTQKKIDDRDGDADDDDDDDDDGRLQSNMFFHKLLATVSSLLLFGERFVILNIQQKTSKERNLQQFHLAAVSK